MNKETFTTFVDEVSWRFAKRVPNWPHFYIVEQELADQEVFRAARSFIRDLGRDGRFYDLEVRYYDADGWTYWASPLAKTLDSQYMLNRCRTEFTYDSLAQSGTLPPEGFEESALNLSPVLEDPDFKSLVRDATSEVFTVFEVLGTTDYEIRHSNVLAWLLDSKGNHGRGSLFAQLLWKQIADSQQRELPNISFKGYTVDREGCHEDGRIDLLLLDKDRRWIIVIENKLFSPETGDQLDRYFHYIERGYFDVSHRLYFYLTPHGISPKREADASNWILINYNAVTLAIAEFLKTPLTDRIKDFLEQYLEHIERSVLKSATATDRMRSTLRKHRKVFHSLEFMLNEKSVRSQCSDAEFNLLESIIAVQQEVESELFEFTKQMMLQHGYKRFSGLAHWITIEIPGLKERLIASELLSAEATNTFSFVFDSTPHSYRVEVWLAKRGPLYSKSKGRLMRFSTEGPEPNRGDEHLVEVLFRRTIISPEKIIQESLSELKKMIADYFGSDLQNDLAEALGRIGAWADTMQPLDKRLDGNA